MIALIALLTMTIDHIGAVYFPDITIFRIIGRLAFPLFAWGIARGYKLTRNFNKYAVRLLLIALISQAPFYLIFRNGYMNICFTLLAGLFTLKIYDSKLLTWSKVLLIVLVMATAQHLKFEYGIYGILSIILFFHFWENERIIYYYGGLTLASTLIFRYDPIQLFAVFSPFIILCINLTNKDFRLYKYFQYSFYPIHLLILFLFKNGGI